MIHKSDIVKELEKRGILNTALSRVLTDAYIIKDFVSLVGSVAEKGTGNDIDLLIRLSEPNDFLKRAIRTRCMKTLESYGIYKDVHVFFESEGPHDNFIPLFDLKIERTEPASIEMSESVTPMKPFKPMKSSPSAEVYYKVEDIVRDLYGSDNG